MTAKHGILPPWLAHHAAICPTPSIGPAPGLLIRFTVKWKTSGRMFCPLSTRSPCNFNTGKNGKIDNASLTLLV